MASISGYVLERVAYEIRYAKAFALWDQAGAVAESVLTIAPDAQNLDAQPNRIAFRLDDTHEVVVELNQARIVAFYPAPSLERTAEIAHKFFSSVVSLLRPRVLERVGGRFMYFKNAPDAISAAQSVMALNCLVVPPSLLEHDKNIVVNLPDVAFRLQSTNMGTLFRIRAEERKLEVNPTLDMRRLVAAKTETEHGIALDVDHYTLLPVRISQIHYSDWLLQASRISARDGTRLVEHGKGGGT